MLCRRERPAGRAAQTLHLSPLHKGTPTDTNAQVHEHVSQIACGAHHPEHPRTRSRSSHWPASASPPLCPPRVSQMVSPARRADDPAAALESVPPPWPQPEARRPAPAGSGRREDPRAAAARRLPVRSEATQSSESASRRGAVLHCPAGTPMVQPAQRSCEEQKNGLNPSWELA